MDGSHGWQGVDETLQKYDEYFKEIDTKQRKGKVSLTTAEIEFVSKLSTIAHKEWLEAWKETYQSLCLFVVQDAIHSQLCYSEDRYYCKACGYEIFDMQIRDHFLVNCPEMRKSVQLPLLYMFDLKTLLYVPCGAHVEPKLYYLAEIMNFYQRIAYDDMCEPPEVRLHMRGYLEVETETPDNTFFMDSRDPAYCQFLEFSELSCSHWAKDMTVTAAEARYARSMDTIRKRM